MITELTYPFSLPPLPYSYDALEPYIDAETMHFHHDKHFQTYIDNLNTALKDYPEYQSHTLTQLWTALDRLPPELQTAVRNNGGGVYNHDLYFDLMAPPGQKIAPSILDFYDDGEEFWSEMKTAALGQFGSGFAWLVTDQDNDLQVLALPNQDNPLSYGYQPILPLDVWEHAYYLKYKNLRGDYINNWFHVINWAEVEKKIAQSMIPSAS